MTCFSVIIPTYNRKAYLLECLRTVFEQSYPAHEVIVVDDGSTDGTVEALSTFEDRVQIIRQSNAGPGAARNRGAQVATGDYLAFLDSDDLWFPWTLASFAELIERNGRPSFLSGRPVDFDKIDEIERIQFVEPRGDFFKDYLASHDVGCFYGSGSMVLSRTAFELVSGFEKGTLNAEDHDLALQLGTAPGFVAIAQPVTLGRRLHSGNATADFSNSLGGLMRLVTKEQSGLYPGGADRRLDRQEIIARHLRPAVIYACKSGLSPECWDLYLKTFGWNLKLRRIRYLIAAPILYLLKRYIF